MSINNPSKKRSDSGVALLFTILMIGILLSIILVLSNIFAIKLKLSAETRYSVSAYYAAESGVEYCLYLRTSPTPVPDPPVLDNGATFDTGDTCASGNIRSVGSFRNVSRAIEISY
ncbi:MAG: hypothetical protein ABR875_02035 [Minisyncoccia bacterium]